MIEEYPTRTRSAAWPEKNQRHRRRDLNNSYDRPYDFRPLPSLYVCIAHRNVQANPKVRVEILVIYFYFSAFFKMRIALSASAALSKAK